jgi:hypothetical protein
LYKRAEIVLGEGLEVVVEAAGEEFTKYCMEAIGSGCYEKWL